MVVADYFWDGDAFFDVGDCAFYRLDRLAEAVGGWVESSEDFFGIEFEIFS